MKKVTADRQPPTTSELSEECSPPILSPQPPAMSAGGHSPEAEVDSPVFLARRRDRSCKTVACEKMQKMYTESPDTTITPSDR